MRVGITNYFFHFQVVDPFNLQVVELMISSQVTA